MMWKKRKCVNFRTHATILIRKELQLNILEQSIRGYANVIHKLKGIWLQKWCFFSSSSYQCGWILWVWVSKQRKFFGIFSCIMRVIRVIAPALLLISSRYKLALLIMFARPSSVCSTELYSIHKFYKYCARKNVSTHYRPERSSFAGQLFSSFVNNSWIL